MLNITISALTQGKPHAFRYTSGDERHAYFTCCAVPKEVTEMIEEWRTIPYDRRYILGGVIADALEESRNEILATAVGAETTLAFDIFVAYLRATFATGMERRL